MPVRLNYFFSFGDKPWLLTVPIRITFHYSIKLSTIYITEVFYFCSIVIIEEACSCLTPAALETRCCPHEGISWDGGRKIPPLDVRRRGPGGKGVHLGLVGHRRAFICKEKVGLDQWFLNWRPLGFPGEFNSKGWVSLLQILIKSILEASCFLFLFKAPRWSSHAGVRAEAYLTPPHHLGGSGPSEHTSESPGRLGKPRPLGLTGDFPI